MSTPLSEALTEVALGGVEHEEAFKVCDMMCRISMLGCCALKASTSYP